MTKSAVVIGAGDNLGAAIARRFAKEGLHVVVVRRRGDLSKVVSDIQSAGGQATGIHADARDEEAIQQVFANVERDIGPIAACIFNVGGNVKFPIRETTSRVFRKVWEMCAFAAFLTGREAATVMAPRGEGTILFTGASASLRGNANFAAFTSGKQAMRALAQSMARELGPQGVHVAHVVVDGLIENQNTKDMFPELYASRGEDGILKPDDMADAYWMLHKQPRNAWTFELDLRPYKEPW